MRAKNAMDLLRGDIRPIYFKYLAAASGSAMVASIFGVVDAMMVGQYHGPIGSAALAVFSPLWSVIFCLGLLAGIGGSVLFAACRGSGREEEAQEYFTLSLLYGVALSAAAMVVIGVFQEELFCFFGADAEMLHLAKLYLKPILFAIPCCVFSNILSAYLRNDGNPDLATAAVLAGGAFNCVGDYVCVFVLDMGIAGAGLATAAGQYVGIFVMLFHFFGKKNTLRLVRPTGVLRKLGAITLNGCSTAVTDLAMGIIGILFNRQIMGHLGSDALSVYGVLAQVMPFAQCLAYGAGQAAQPIISQNYGAGQPGRIRRCLKYGLVTSAVMGVFWTAVMLIFPEQILNFFMTPTPAVAEIAPAILRIYGVSFLLLPFNVFATYYFQAMMQANLAMTASLARGVVISGALILVLPAVAGADSIWYAMLLTELLTAAYSAWHMAKSTRRLEV